MTERRCAYCGKVMERIRYKNGNLESMKRFNEKQFCNMTCFNKSKRFGGKFVDLSGKEYGMIKVIEPVVIKDSKGKRRIKWKCECKCGNIKVMDGKWLRNGSTKSCGCWRNKRHGMSYSELYTHWQSMKARCKPYYHSPDGYLERGITVCEEWRDSFDAFMEWAIENGYKDGLTLDRIDNDGNYEPDNCRWTTVKVQANNRRSSVRYELDGKALTLSEWSDISGIDYQTIRQRIVHGWDLRRAIYEKPDKRYGGRKGVPKNRSNRK